MTLLDLAAILGVLVALTGVWLLFVPAALIVGGLVLAGVCVQLGRGA